MTETPFPDLDPEMLDRAARRHGFTRNGRSNWVRRTADFVQLVNLQRSQWSPQVRYLNFAMWALAFGEPPVMAEHRFQFRTRAEKMCDGDLPGFFAAADRLTTLDDLRAAERADWMSCLINRDLRALLDRT